ncbi:unnamed protein product [Owenia fusiformis]|uniref:Uncharacterized protein n=1 Tax=Owenia fusiformis TaxID=6347 RepID=A0A8J1THJ2_OWEFU|nr:unnamed protein product [Owenia fusiformis]
MMDQLAKEEILGSSGNADTHTMNATATSAKYCCITATVVLLSMLFMPFFLLYCLLCPEYFREYARLLIAMSAGTAALVTPWDPKTRKVLNLADNNDSMCGSSYTLYSESTGITASPLNIIPTNKDMKDGETSSSGYSSNEGHSTGRSNGSAKTTHEVLKVDDNRDAFDEFERELDAIGNDTNGTRTQRESISVIQIS